MTKRIGYYEDKGFTLTIVEGKDGERRSVGGGRKRQERCL